MTTSGSVYWSLMIKTPLKPLCILSAPEISLTRELKEHTSFTSCQWMGDRRYPCLNIRNLKNGNATHFEKNTLPMLAGIYAKAYLTHRMTTSSNHDAC
jgi:hypothetical protein